MYEASLSCSPTQQENILPQHHTGIVYYRATHLYIAPSAPHGKPNTKATPINVGTANGQMVTSTETATLPINQLSADFPTTGYIMPSFTNTIIGVELICNADCKIFFTKKDVVVILPEGKTILTVWREKNLPKLWRFPLKPNEQGKIDTKTNLITTAAHNAYNLPNLEALVRYMHTAAGFPVKSTWLKAIKKGNFATWPGLRYSNVAKYCTQSVETLKGHMVQASQGVQSTNKKTHKNQVIKKVNGKTTIEKEYDEEELLPPIEIKEFHIWDHPISKIYTDDCGRFPIRSRSGNEYIMIAYHCDSNTILQAPFVNRKEKHRIRAYNKNYAALN